MQKFQHRITSFTIYTRPLWRRLIYSFALVALMFGTLFDLAIPAVAQSAAASVTDCLAYGSAGEAGTLADALATSSEITFDCTGTIIVPEIFVTQDLTISGQEGVVLSGDGNNRVLSIAVNTSVEINDLILEQGNGNVDEVAVGNVGEGGNVYNAGSLTINNSIIQDSRFTISGAGIYNVGQLELNNVTFDGGGGDNGGGIFNGGEARAQGLTMKNLGADGGAAAIFNRDTLVIEDCLIENTSSRFNLTVGNSGSLIMNDCVMRQAGSLENFNGGTLSLNRSTLDSNAGAGWVVDNKQNSSVSLADVTISNTAGGAIPLRNDGEAQIQNSTVSNNFLPNTSAILNSGTMSIKNSTITNNQPLEGAAFGGGIRNDGTLTLWDTIVADQGNGLDCSGSAPITSNGYNLDSDGTCNLNATGDIPNGNANLGPLQDNGGPTFTHELLPGSDAIDAGNCSDETILMDQRGIPRPQDEACDIGAFELTMIELPEDRNALIALYNSTDGDNWVDNTDWLNGNHCTWHGVECESGQVITLDLSSNQLVGTIPPEIGNLINLQELNLQDNPLSGAIPPELGNLISLRYLLLSETQLSGSIPPEFGNLASLSQLYIDNTQISGAIPPGIGNLTDLVFLLLGRSQFSGSVPPELGNLTNLTTLVLYNNQLSGAIPPELGNLENLVALYLNGNQFSGALPIEMGDIESLGQLYLDSNSANFCVPLELGALVDQLETYTSPPGGFCGQEGSPDRDALIALYNSTDGDIWLDNTNWLEGDHCDWFSVTCRLGRVISLGLGDNQLSGSIPPELGTMTNLQTLSLWGNQLSGTIPPELGNLINLGTLGLGSNQLTGAIPPEFGNLKQLYRLQLESNQLTGIIPNELGNITNLDTLYLHDNQLTGSIPPELGNLKSLAYLYLNNNQLSGIIPAELDGAFRLEHLHLENNQLTGPIPPELGNFLILLELDLGDNQLNGSIPPELENLADDLWKMNLSNNQLSGAVPLEFANLTNLRWLDLNGNNEDLCMPVELESFTNGIDVYNPPSAGFCEGLPPVVPETNGIEIEAESGELSGDFAIGFDESANGGAYIYVPGEVGNRGATPDESQSVKFTFNLEEDGIYRIAGIVNAPDIFSNSFYIKIDGFPSQGYTWHNQVGAGYAFEYVTDGPNIDMVERVLTAGEHTLTVYLRETNTRFDKIIIERVSDLLVEPKPGGCDGLVREAEAGDWAGNFTVGADENASGGFYVHVPEGLGSRGDFPDAAQKASYCFTVEEAGTYRIKAWAYADSPLNNSFFVTVNDDTAANVGAYERAWHTRVNTEYAPEYVTRHDVINGEFRYPLIEVELEAGVHTVYFFLREDGTRLDKVSLEPVNMTHTRARRHAASWPDGLHTFLPFLKQ